MNPPAVAFRWLAIVHYRTKNGPVEVPHYIEEMSELHQLVELGPHWDTIIKVVVSRVNPTDAFLTIEEAARQ